MNKPAPTDYPIHDLLRDRWSPRAFSQRPVEQAKLLSLFEAARWAPSSSNEQPWRFIAATKDDPDAYAKLFSIIREGNQRWAQNAPVLLLGLTKTTRKDYRNKNAQHDLGLAVANMTVQATALGLVVHQMGGIYDDLAREIYGIPEEYEVMNAIAIGYADDPGTLPDDLREREEAPRHRKPLSEFVFREWEETSPILAPQEDVASV